MSNNNNKSPMTPEHFSDYGFDPHFDCFQAVEATKNLQSEDLTRSIDSFRLNLHKKKNRRWWRWKWNKAFNFFKCTTNQHTHMVHNNEEVEDRDVHFARARDFRSAVSGTLYMTQTPPHYGSHPHPGLISPAATASGCSSPYLSLRELNIERQHLRKMNMSGSASASPLYLVT